MHIDLEQLNEIIHRPLLASGKPPVKPNLMRPVDDPFERQRSARLEPLQSTDSPESLTPVGDFIKLEKNLISFGFFTPSNKRIKTAKAKTISLVRISPDGQNKEVATATIVPAAMYGLPITADQDKWFALHKIIDDIRQGIGEVRNPITFTSAELLKLLNHTDAGKNYQEISDWLDLMTNTGIISEGAVYLAGKKKWARDRFRVFDRAVSFGRELDDGTVADRNYVWLSEWQLQNINHNYLLPIEYDTYQQLQNHIAKALVPLLQVWLYASRNQGRFEKLYDELCQTLNVRPYQYLSKIKEKLGPSLNELKSHGYLADWQIEKTSDKKAYKVVFYHGDKFHRDRRRRLHQKEQASKLQRPLSPKEPYLEQGTGTDLLDQLTRRGITQPEARKLLEHLTDDQEVIDQLEWGDYLIAQTEPGKIYNPAGFYIHLIKENVPPAVSFESSRKRRLRQEAKSADRLQQESDAQLKLAYEIYRAKEIDQYIAIRPEDYAACVAERRQQLTDKRLSSWGEPTLTKLAELAARSEIAKRLSFDTFAYFSRRYRTERPALSAPPAHRLPEQGADLPGTAEDDYFVV